MIRGWQHAACPGGISIIGRGASLAEAFAEAAVGVFALVAPPTAVAERERRELRAHGESAETLLANWIGECLYLYEVEGFIARRVQFITFQDHSIAGGEPLRLHAWLHGEELDGATYAPTTAPQALEPTGMSVKATDTGIEVAARLLTTG